MNIIARDLTKSYRNKTVLNSINFTISHNSILGVMGKNGAGKTTLNKLICGLTLPSSGEILIGDEPATKAFKKVSLLSENISIYPNLSAWENLEQIFLINNIKPDKKKTSELLDIISLDNMKKPAKNFSLGMKRRLQIAMSTMIVPKDIIILDEPTNGLDINGLLWLKEQIKTFKEQGKTIIISSHAINELETLFTDYMIIANGKIVESKNIKEDYLSELHLGVEKDSLNNTKKIIESLNLTYSIDNDGLIIIKLTIDNIQGQIFTELSKNKITPTTYTIRKQSLVDIYSRYIKNNS